MTLKEQRAARGRDKCFYIRDRRGMILRVRAGARPTKKTARALLDLAEAAGRMMKGKR